METTPLFPIRMGWKRRLADFLISPFVLLGALPLRFVRSMGIADFPMSKAALLRAGVFPIRNHFYEPLFDTRDLKPQSCPRLLPGIDLNLDVQKELLASFQPDQALERLPAKAPDDLTFGFDNTQFGPGDAELWYHVIRTFKPAKIIEVGSGHSTRLARLAISANAADDPEYACEHVCIEPFRMPWLERLGPTIIRKRVEDLDPSIFTALGRNDILFIDSSHIIRPGGDVIFQYLELLPTLAPGVVVHVHDIFTPRGYLDRWVRDDVLFWNEQYLLEAFLTHNRDWEVLLTANFLKHECFQLLAHACPHLGDAHEPASFYIRRR